ncbi:MAG: head decoration protein [Nitrospirae bacterium]|nr:head decoration protein [Nitrospirota bacterium]
MDINPSFTSTPYAPDRLIAGDFPLVTETVTVAAGQNLVRGALLGKVTAGGQYVLSLAAAVDGSQTPVAILVADADASAGALTAGIYVSGEFNDNAVTFGTGHTAASVKDGLRDLGIYLKSPVPA